jgi:hypothetical protein
MAKILHGSHCTGSRFRGLYQDSLMCLQSVCAETFHTPSSELYPERTDDWGSVCVQSKIESSLFINCPDATITTIYWGCFKNYCGPFQDYKCCDFEVYVDWPMAYLRHAL